MTAGAAPDVGAVWLAPADAARLLGLSVRALQKRAKAGKVERRRDGRRSLYRVSLADARAAGAELPEQAAARLQAAELADNPNAAAAAAKAAELARLTEQAEQAAARLASLTELAAGLAAVLRRVDDLASRVQAAELAARRVIDRAR